jgi:hypothetical protein
VVVNAVIMIFTHSVSTSHNFSEGEIVVNKQKKLSLQDLMKKVKPLTAKQTVYGKGVLSTDPNGRCVFKPGTCYIYL